jgi:hypothetical protein
MLPDLLKKSNIPKKWEFQLAGAFIFKALCLYFSKQNRPLCQTNPKLGQRPPA